MSIPARSRHAVTLIETIVVIGIVAVLMALLVPALGGARLAAANNASLRNLKTHAQVASLYAGDFRDMAPFIADPDATYTVARGGGITMEFEFFESSEAWVVALVDRYYQIGIADSWEVFAYPGPEPGLYQYSPSFIAKPAFWNMRTRADNQLGPNRLASVASPSAKTIFLEFNPRVGFPVWTVTGVEQQTRWGMSFVDGSARRIDSASLTEPVRAGEGTAHGFRFNVGVCGMHTVDGVLGRDVR